MGVTSDTSINGGVDVEYAYGSAFTLDNSADSIHLRYGTVIFDQMSYDVAQGYSIIEGTTLAADLDSMSDQSDGADANDNSSMWCNSILEYGDGDFGTPGQWNDSCTSIDIDGDGDGFFSNVDCDDADPDTYPGAAFYDSVFLCMTDVDGDDYGSDVVSSAAYVGAGSDCDDSDASINPGATDPQLDCNPNTQ